VAYPLDERPPGYRELAAILRERIQTGQIQPGQRLPSETTLSQTYAVNRLTARTAVHRLAEDGLVDLRDGYGWVVRAPRPLEPYVAEPGSVIRCRPPTDEERERWQVPRGVHMLEVVAPGGHGDAMPGDRYEVRTLPV
jgi:DNA-binding transcriptional MocR family regulator